MNLSGMVDTSRAKSAGVIGICEPTPPKYEAGEYTVYCGDVVDWGALMTRLRELFLDSLGGLVQCRKYSLCERFDKLYDEALRESGSELRRDGMVVLDETLTDGEIRFSVW